MGTHASTKLEKIGSRQGAQQLGKLRLNFGNPCVRTAKLEKLGSHQGAQQLGKSRTY